MDHEDPTRFLSGIEEFFRRELIFEEDERIEIFASGLRERALSWFRPLRPYFRYYADLRTRFLAKFQSSRKILDLRADLYGKRQLVEQSAENFIMTKEALYWRMHPEGFEEDLIKLIINLMRPEIRSRLRGSTFFSIEQLTGVAMEIEEDLREEVGSRRGPIFPTWEPRRPLPVQERPVIRRAIEPPPPVRETGAAPRSIKKEERTSTCFKCGQSGHFKRECPQMKREKKKLLAIEAAVVNEEENEERSISKGEGSQRTKEDSRTENYRRADRRTK